MRMLWRLDADRRRGRACDNGASDAQESAVLDLMRKRFDHVSAERVLSGPGLVNLYNVLCELAAVPAAPFTAPQITDPRILG